MTFAQAVTRVIFNEGGYTPGLANDPGGETNYGISKRSYPNLDIKNLSRDQACEIYRVDFWNKVSGELLPVPLQYQVLDFAVNSGVEKAIRELQILIGAVPDGVIGPNTLAALAKQDAAKLAIKYLAARVDFLRGLRNYPTFAAGWSRRIANSLRYISDDM